MRLRKQAECCQSVMEELLVGSVTQHVPAYSGSDIFIAGCPVQAAECMGAPSGPLPVPGATVESRNYSAG